MRIFRFDPELARPVEDGGSRFQLGRLFADGTGVSASVLYFGPRGRAVGGGTEGQQLWAVVVGGGWVGGPDAARRLVSPGYAVLWEEGEKQDAGSDAGMTVVCLAGAFDVRAYAVTTEVVVTDYDPAWPEWFGALCERIWPAVKDVALRIDHVGSTSVPGLPAKPIIDMDVVVPDETAVHPAIDALTAVGYEWRGDLGVPGRQAFEPPAGTDLPAHHLYLVVEDNKAHLDHWLLRDLLRGDPEARARYGDLKRRNAEAAAGDIDYYVAAKAELVAELLTRAREERGLPPASYWEPELPERA